MDIKKLLQIIGFRSKENALGIFEKKYPLCDNYVIEVDFDKKVINYGDKILAESKTTQNFSQPENFVVLECVNRFLEMGYQPENIVLEPTWKLGHIEKGRLDILVKKDDKAYLMIECKTHGKEYNKELKNLHKDGGQLFSYFQQDKNAEILMLYTFDIQDNKTVPQCEIIKIEEEYRLTASVKDFYEKWNKLTKNNGVWENPPYDFKPKSLTKNDLVELNEGESKKIFHEFASILRKHSVSDKPNAFNKIFNLFLAKLYDEAKGDDDELEFHWREDDNPVDFQVRLVNLHKEGLYAFLEKEIEGIDDSVFSAGTPEELLEKKKKVLKFNNILAIKEVLDDASFDENHRVLKDVVKLLEKYQIRYPRKQQHLSDFFEKLLTTGLKQEVGQFFTPPPITKFIVRSIPIQHMIEQDVNQQIPKLPAVIDYAAGSGHFITEAMEEYQNIINQIDSNTIKYPKAKSELASWKADPYNWAAKYVYGIEKDYRLVKVAKVGCYFYGDGVAQIIHGDGLDSFKNSKTYKGLLKNNADKPQFSLVLSNPPYSVNDCKDDLEYIEAQNDYELYPYLTDKSKDIECLFVERTKHLLKEGGIAAVILPSSILNNTGIQTKTREIILQYFDIVAIVELGGNTFMATNTNTVTLFLKRKSDHETTKLKTYVDKFFTEYIDNAISNIEYPVSKYVAYVWENVSLEDYVSLLKKQPNEQIQQHDIYKEYRKKIKVKKEEDFWVTLIETEKDKLHYFLLAYHQKDVVLIKSRQKDAEKRFLGYEFSNRRGNEGIHSMVGGKTIDEATQLYNPNNTDDRTKASAYIYNAFLGNKNLEVAENLINNISYIDLLDMLTFDRCDFEKTISLSAKKKVKIESKWEIKNLGEVVTTQYGFTDKAESTGKIRYLRITDLSDDGTINISNEAKYINPTDEIKEQFLLRNNDIVIARSGSVGKSAIYKSDKYEEMIFASYLVRLKVDVTKISPDYLFNFTKTKMYWNQVEANSIAVTQPNLNAEKIKMFKIPLPPLDIQQKIVSKIEFLEQKEEKSKKEIERLREKVLSLFEFAVSKANNVLRLSDNDIFDISIGKRVLKSEFVPNGKIPVYSANVIEPFGNIDKLLIEDFDKPSILWGIDGDWMVNCIPANSPFYPTDHCGVLRVKNDSINERYLAFVLEKEGKNFGFSRTKRASIDRVQGIKIPVPPLSEQEKIVSEIEKIEAQISQLENEIAEISKQKESVLRGYLN